MAIVVTGEDAEAVAVLAAVTVEASVAVAAGTNPAEHEKTGSSNTGWPVQTRAPRFIKIKENLS